MCRRLIINAGIQRVVIRRTPDQYAVVHVEDWIREDDSLPGALGETAGEPGGCGCCR